MAAIADLRQKTDDELREMLLGLRRERLNMRFLAASGQLKDTARARAVRRDIARVKTLRGERARAAAKSKG